MSTGLPLDSSMPPMEENRVKKKHYELMREIIKKVHFKMVEIEALVLIYHKIQKKNKLPGIEQFQFFEVLQKGFDMTDIHMNDRILLALNNGIPTLSNLSLEFWIRAMSLFLRGTFEEQMNHCFLVYSGNMEGFLGRENIFQLLRHSMTSPDDDPEEIVKDLVDVIMRKLDKDRDGRVSFSDYKISISEVPNLLECMGQCLPSKFAVLTFTSTIFPDVPLGR